jgi:hypothetical protein
VLRSPREVAYRQASRQAVSSAPPSQFHKVPKKSVLYRRPRLLFLAHRFPAARQPAFGPVPSDSAIGARTG